MSSVKERSSDSSHMREEEKIRQELNETMKTIFLVLLCLLQQRSDFSHSEIYIYFRPTDTRLKRLSKFLAFMSVK